MPTSIAELMQNLIDLGLTDEVLRAAGAADGVRPNQSAMALYEFKLRISLYYDALVQVRNAIEGLSEIYGPRLSNAITDRMLLAGFCKIVDGFVVPALNFDLGGSLIPALRFNINNYPDEPAAGLIQAPQGYYVQGQTIQNNLNNYYNANILTEDYNNKILQFRARYPTTRHAIETLSTNFIQNTITTFNHIRDDWANIERVFDVRLRRLRSVQLMGNDLHKGNKQVMLLTFDRVVGVLQRSATFRLMYKPSDIEVDCLLVGDSAAVNRRQDLLGPFMQQSLFELANGFLELPEAYRLRTYKILPMHYGSGYNLAPVLGVVPQYSVRESYGYIEYLPSDDAPGPHVGNWYPLGASDFRFYKQGAAERTETIRRLYFQAGMLIALASTFSLSDLHLENVRITDFYPHLIDLENALTRAIIGVQDTQLLTRMEHQENQGGLNGARGPVWAWRCRLNHLAVGDARAAPDDRKLYYSSEQSQESAKNRLYHAPPGSVVRVDVPAMLQGLYAMINAIGAHVADFHPFFARLRQSRGVVVRYIPADTVRYMTLRELVFDWRPYQDIDVAVNAVTAREYWDMARTDPVARENPGDPPPPLPPGYLPRFRTFDPIYTGPELRSCDIPIYYHRILNHDNPLSRQVFDSRDHVIAVQNETTVNNPNDAAQSATVTTYRDSYFIASPTSSIVQQEQLGPLAIPADRVARRDVLVVSITAETATNVQTDQLFNQP